jgi:excisionase family DNA binding protein
MNLRTDKPLLVSVAEASFQLSLPNEEIAALVRDGELVAVKVRDQVLIVYDSLTAFTRRARRSSAAVVGVARAGSA